MKKRWIFGGIAALALVFSLLHTSWVQNFARRAIEGWVVSKLGGTASLEGLDYRLWRGEAVLRGLSLEPKAPFFLVVPTTTFRWVPWSGATLQVAGPNLIVIERTESSDSNVVETASPALPALLSRLEIRNGSVQVGSGDGEAWLELSSIDVDLDHRTDSYEGRFQAAKGRVGEVPLGPMTADFQGGRDRVDFEKVRIEKDSSHIQATVSITSLSPLVAHAVVDFAADSEILNELQPDLDLSGTITGKADLNWDSTDLSGSIELSSPQLTSPLGTWSVETGATLLYGALEVNRIHLVGYGGTIDAEGRADFTSDENTLEARFAGLELGPLLELRAERDIPVTGRVDGEFRARWTGWDRRGLDGTARISLEPSPTADGVGLRGTFEIASKNGTILLETDSLHLFDGPLTIRSKLGPDGGWSATYSAENVEVHRLDRLLESLDLPVPPPDLQGGLSFHGRASGLIGDAALTTSNLTLSGNNLAFRGQRFETEADLRVAESELYIDAFEIRGKQGQIAIQGKVRNETLNVTGLIEDFEIAGLAASYQVPIEGRIAGRIDLSGPLEDPDYSVYIRGSPLSFRELTGDAVIDLRKQGRELYLDRIEVRVDESKGLVSGLVDLESQQVDLKLDASDWRLSQVLPEATWLDAVASSNGKIQGNLRAPAGDLRLSLDDITLRGETMPAVIVEAESDGHDLTAEARLADGSTLASGQIRLVTPYPSRLSLSLASLPLTEILKGLFPSTSGRHGARCTRQARAFVSFNSSRRGPISSSS